MKLAAMALLVTPFLGAKVISVHSLESRDSYGLASFYRTSLIPPRAPDAMTGTEFIMQSAPLALKEREALIFEQLSAGNMPLHLRLLKPVTMTQVVNGKVSQARFWVMPDYLAIGSDDDFVRVPMSLQTATKLASRFGFVLPTRGMVDSIFQQAETKLEPRPLPPGKHMIESGYYYAHHQLIEQQLQHVPKGALVSGHKKDLVLSERLNEKVGRVAIYGWHMPNGEPIQPLSIIHGERYADYSHGVRFVAEAVEIDGAQLSIYNAMRDSQQAQLLGAGHSILNVKQIMGELPLDPPLVLFGAH